jgi:spore cortex formation protein SpoVR/YcgB (stage V sporulation)
MTTEQKQEMIDRIEIFIIDLQCDLSNELTLEEEVNDIKLDLESSKTILGHLLTLKTA